MISAASSSQNLEEATPPLSVWEQQASSCGKGLALKVTSVAVVAIANIAILIYVFYQALPYIPTQALIASPIIVGVLASFSYLEIPTFGIQSTNYTSYVNPAYLLGRTVSYLFFYPLVYATSKVDWTPYHDPIRANKISHQLEKDSFDKIADTFSHNSANLVKYGFIPQEHKDEFLTLSKNYNTQKKALDFWKREDPEGEEHAEVQAEIEKIKDNWVELKKRFPANSFPHPKKPRYDFSKPSTSLALKVRKYCCFHPSIDTLPRF